ncbi:MAG: hydrogenase 3 maturation endopeptidase HyCI [Calditrichia bacterium]
MKQKGDQMDDQLLELIKQYPLIIGIGNTLRGDDGAGVILVERLIARGYDNALVVHSTPENYLRRIAESSANLRLWVDIINWGGKPGDWRILDHQEIGNYAISTHNFSPVVLLEFLKEWKDIPDYFLGIQPRSTNLGEGISEEVSLTINKLSDLIFSAIDTDPDSSKR